MLDHLGLAAAVEWQIKEFAGRTGLNWDTSIDIEKDNYNRNLSAAVFRILQEALTNIARHAEATKVPVSLSEKDGLLVLEVIDNGNGIISEKLSDPHSFGLMGMRERVQSWDGSIMISGMENKGTTVRVSIPPNNKGKE
jgi:signal transduction histidine kinase